jgi:phosphoribosylaminoimidazole-succinocarboxamide synthase
VVNAPHMPVDFSRAVVRTDLPFPNRREGKVRDVYDLPPDPAASDRPPALLIVASDRLSAFDVVLPTPIPGKGRILTDLSAKWFEFIESKGLARTHLLSTKVDDVPGLSERDRDALRGRTTIGRRCRVVQIECVARGYLAGSGTKDYLRDGAICGVALPPGLRDGDSILEKLGAPIFTPATKEQQGKHDENITFERACELVGRPLMERLRDATLAIYSAAHDYARARGVILADTKFEFGFPVDERGEVVSDELILVDEALTPDSSRYWPLENWTPGAPEGQQSFDKQFVREYLETLVREGKWDKRAPGPALPDSVVSGTLERYEEARRRLFA